MVLNKREKNIGIFAGIAIAILLVNYAAIDPLMAAKDDLEKRKTDAQGQLDQKVQTLKRSKDDGPRWNEMNRSGLLRDSSAAESQIYGAISSWGREAGLDPPTLAEDRSHGEIRQVFLQDDDPRHRQREYGAGRAISVAF